jgi:hypothetical protein
MPKCSVCDEDLGDWEGNVMVDEDRFLKHKKVYSLFIICKPCTNKSNLNKKLKGLPAETRMHALWELGWFKNNYETLIIPSMRDLADFNVKFEKEAKQTLRELVLEAHPGSATDVKPFESEKNTLSKD